MNGTSDMYAYSQQMDPDFSKWRLNPKEILTLLERNLRGEIWDPREKEWVKKGKELMNDEGISMIISAANMRVNKVTMLTSFTEDQVFRMMENFEIHLDDLLFEKMSDFKIRSLADADFIIEAAVDTVFAALKKSEDAGERESLDRNEQIVRHIQTQAERGGRMPRIFSRGGGAKGEY